jgi:hypothetical protein
LTFDGTNLQVTGNETVTGISRVTSGGELQVEGDWILLGDPTTQLTSNDWYGEAVTFGGAGASTQYSVYQWRSGSVWTLTDADGASTSTNLLAMAIDTQFLRGMLLRGYVYNSAWNWTSIGGELYLSTTAGDITQTQPTGSGDIVRVVGYAINADLIYFNPSQDWIELA